VHGHLTVVFLLIAPGAAFAHHAGLYDENNVITLGGTIAEIEWINPHVRLTLETRAADGSTERWQVEGTSVNALERWGVRRDWFAVGDTISVKGPTSRYEQKAIVGAIVQLPDSREVFLWPNVASRLKLADTGVEGLFPPPAADAAPASADRGVFKVWTPRGRPPRDASDLPLTQRARELAATYRPLEDDPALKCVPPGMPVMLDTPYPVEFVDEGERIVMRLEEWDGMRTIYMKPGGGPPLQAHSPNGISFGRWEGKTLAIFTTYIDYAFLDDLGTPQSNDVTVLERYTPSDDGARLDWETTVTDPAMLTRPVTRRGFMAFEPGEKIKPYDCKLAP
jgi:hypothetical protein